VSNSGFRVERVRWTYGRQHGRWDPSPMRRMMLAGMKMMVRLEAFRNSKNGGTIS
jgi:hypothetical protein